MKICILFFLTLTKVLAEDTLQHRQSQTIADRMAGFGTLIPPSTTDLTSNGAAYKSPSGEIVTQARLVIAARLVVPNSNNEALLLMTYLRHPNPLLRYIAADALRVWFEEKEFLDPPTAAIERDENDEIRIRLTNRIIGKTLIKIRNKYDK